MAKTSFFESLAHVAQALVSTKPTYEKFSSSFLNDQQQQQNKKAKRSVILLFSIQAHLDGHSDHSDHKGHQQQ